MNDPSSLFSSRLGRQKHRTTVRQLSVCLQLLKDDKGLIADDNVLASPIGMESRPEEGRRFLGS